MPRVGLLVFLEAQEYEQKCLEEGMWLVHIAQVCFWPGCPGHYA